MIVISQIVRRVWQGKNHKNRSIFGKDMNKRLVARFLWLTCSLAVTVTVCKLSVKRTLSPRM